MLCASQRLLHFYTCPFWPHLHVGEWAPPQRASDGPRPLASSSRSRGRSAASDSGRMRVNSDGAGEERTQKVMRMRNQVCREPTAPFATFPAEPETSRNLTSDRWGPVVSKVLFANFMIADVSLNVMSAGTTNRFMLQSR